MAHAWLALQIAGVIAVVAGVDLLFHLPVALIVAGVIAVVVAEFKMPAVPDRKAMS